MNIGIIGCGSMGKMFLEGFAAANNAGEYRLYAANRTREKLDSVKDIASVCDSNSELAACSDIVFVCVRPADIKSVFEEIAPCLKEDALVVSLNGSIPFALLEKLTDCRLAKVIPGVTAEIKRSQTLVCYNAGVTDSDKADLHKLLSSVGDVIELPEDEMGMGSELVSCMPGFIAALFDVICTGAEKHTDIPHDKVVEMVLRTMSATGDLMLQKGMSFSDVVERVATKGGITEEGTRVIYSGLPDTADELFEKTLEKRRLTAQKARELFGE